MKRALLIVPILFAFSLGAETQTGWKDYGLKEVLGRLKFYAFAKIAQSVRTGVSHFDQEFTLREIPCGEDFPKLEGNFQCALLRVSSLEDHSSGSNSKSSQIASGEGNTSSSSQNPATPSENASAEKSKAAESPNGSQASAPASSSIPSQRSLPISTASSPDPAVSVPKKLPIHVKWYEGSTLAGKGVLLIPGQNGEGDLHLYYHTDGRLSHYSFGDSIVVFDWKGKELSTILSVKVDSRLRPLGGKEYFFP
ncbi:LIC_11883 family protein [Leptospira langatensis]|uniref:LIC_11883 family protein n=1 Tax=Leptospira langatensis TaxID=2484983 RepID=UPI001FE442F3|nr:hypothetical protein [Leptospira langatensis]